MDFVYEKGDFLPYTKNDTKFGNIAPVFITAATALRL